MSETPYMDNVKNISSEADEENTNPSTPDDNTDTEDGPDFSTDDGPTLPLDPPEPAPHPPTVEPVEPPPEPDGDNPIYYASWVSEPPILGEDGIVEEVPHTPFPSAKDEFINKLEETNAIYPEDYLFTIQNKEMFQVRFGQMLRAIEVFCPMEMTRYPGASTLKNLLKEMIEDLHSLKASDIGYDGTIKPQYGTVKGILTYILDTLSNLGASGIKGDGITIDPTGDTPQFVIEDLNGANKLIDILNYIFNNYRYANRPVPGSEVSIIGGNFNALDFDLRKALDQNGKISAQNLFSRMYEYVTETLDHTKTITVFNTISYIMPITEDPIKPVNMNILVPKTTQIEYDIQIKIECNVPGTLCVDIIEDTTSIGNLGYFQDALTTGSHVLRYAGFQNVVVSDDDATSGGKQLPMSLKLTYYIDTTVVGVSEPAVLETNSICFRAKGQHLSTYENAKEGDE